MGRELGRISGSLLAPNLLRDGRDLAFDTNLLYLKVSPNIQGTVGSPTYDDGDPNYLTAPPGPGRTGTGIGIRTDAPVRDLYIENTTDPSTRGVLTTNLIVDNEFTNPGYIISGNTIQQLTAGPMYITPVQSNPIIGASGLSTTELRFYGNTLFARNPNTDINLTPGTTTTVATTSTFQNVAGTSSATGLFFYGFAGTSDDLRQVVAGWTVVGHPTWIVSSVNISAKTITITGGVFVSGSSYSFTKTTYTKGQINVNSSILVNGTLQATGNITWDGNISLGNDSGDSIDFNADVGSDILPSLVNGLPAWNLGSSSLRWLSTNSTLVDMSDDITVPTLNATTFTSGNIQFTNNTIQNIIPTNDINLVPSNDNTLILNDIAINVLPHSSTFLNTSDGPFTLTGTAQGYHVKFSGSGAVVIPTGTTDERPASPETGMTRYNSETGIAELWNGTAWISVAGQSNVLSAEEILMVMDEWTLILG